MGETVKPGQIATEKELELVLEADISAAVARIRARTGCSLEWAFATVKRIAEDLGLMHDEECTACNGSGLIRARKPEYRRSST